MLRRLAGLLAPLGLQLLAACVLLMQALSVFAQTPGLVISQVYGGSSNAGAVYRNDFVELFNAGASAVTLGGKSLQYGSATGNYGASAAQIVSLPAVSLQPGQHFLVQLVAGSQTAAPALPTPDHTGGTDLSGTNGKVALVNGTAALGCGTAACTAAQLAQMIDRVSYGTANNAETSAAPATSGALAVRRTTSCVDTDSNAADFQAVAPLPRNSATLLAACAGVDAPIAATCPASLTLTQGSGSSVGISATDPDSAVLTATPLGTGAVHTVTDLVPAAGDGGTLTATLGIPSNLALGTYSFGVGFTNNDGQTASCTVAVTVASSTLTRIYQIQGSGATSPLVGQTVTTSGVVTLLTNNGFFVQDRDGDGDAATSDGLFVFTGGAPPAIAQPGTLLRVTGVVSEFGDPSTGRSSTQLTSASGITVEGTAAIAPTDIVLPESVEGALEAYEGMLVRIRSTLTVSQNFFQGRFGQVTLSAGGRLRQPTQEASPGAAAAALAIENARRRIVLDDLSSSQNPDPVPYLQQPYGFLRAGDTVGELVGVVDYGLVSSDGSTRDYKLLASLPPAFVSGNPRAATPAAVGGTLKVTSFNVLNYFTTIDQAGAQCLPSNTRTDCRGADTPAEFVRQRDKIVAALVALDADVVGLMEIQRNGQVAVQNLVDAINAVVGPGTWAAVPLPANMGTDAIQVAMIHKPSRVTPVAPAISDPDAIHNRPPLAQGFAAANGERFSVVVNHFKSKGCDGATGAELDQGDGQGCFNSRRTQQAQRLLAFVSNEVRPAFGTDRILIVGDLNAYAKEDPITTLTAAGFVDEGARFEPDGYSYVFDGNAGTLDYVLASPSLSPRVTGAAHWRINADEASVLDYNVEFKSAGQQAALYAPNAFRSSDHDPLVVGLALLRRVDGTAGRDVLVGTAGDDLIRGGPGADTITTGAGRDRIVFGSIRDAQDTVTDFAPAADAIDVVELLASIGYAGTDPVADGVLRWVQQGANTVVSIDVDGPGPGAARPLLTLQNVPAGALAVGVNLIVR